MDGQDALLKEKTVCLTGGEGTGASTIFVTGNTGLDALNYTIRDSFSHPALCFAENARLIFLTTHRRENLGEPMRNIFRAVVKITEEFPDVRVVFPVHKNPAIELLAKEELDANKQIFLSEPMDIVTCHNIIGRCCFVLTDSGGLQEEAPALNKPVLVLRDTTERPEGVRAGTLRLVGTATDNIVKHCRELLEDGKTYEEMATSKNPYGDGKASRRIADILQGL